MIPDDCPVLDFDSWVDYVVDYITEHGSDDGLESCDVSDCPFNRNGECRLFIFVRHLLKTLKD
jgi:hypothetical protein